MSNFVVSGSKFTRFFLLNTGGIAVNTLVFRFWISQSVREIFTVEVKVVQKHAKVCTSLTPPDLFRGRVPKFWDLDYKTEYTSDHMAKFQVDRPRKLRDLSVKKGEKKHQQ